MQQAQPGDMAIVDFKLGGTETRTMTYGSGGSGAIIMGSGVLSGGWTRTESIQTNTIPMPDGSIRQMTVNPGEEEVLRDSRLSAACFMGRKGRWHWIAVKNFETETILLRNFNDSTAKEIDMQPPLYWVKALLSVIVYAVLAFTVMLVLAGIEAGEGVIIVTGLLLLFVGLPAWIFFVSGRMFGPLSPGKVKRRGRKLLEAHR